MKVLHQSSDHARETAPNNSCTKLSMYYITNILDTVYFWLFCWKIGEHTVVCQNIGVVNVLRKKVIQ